MGDSVDKRWEHFAHESDIGVRGVGKSLKEAFEMAAMALSAVVVDLDQIKPVEAITVACSAQDTDFLLYDWLNAIIFEMDTRRMIFSKFEIGDIDARSLQAVIKGERVDRDRHKPAVHVKGATLSELRVAEENGSWIAQCIIDV
jgi:SHS2 domain-containing protein